MKSKKFIEIAKKCLGLKTRYVLGGWGQHLPEDIKSKENQYEFNRSATRKPILDAMTGDTFGFDCNCWVKAILWGFTGDINHRNGGATYVANGVPDCNIPDILSGAKISTDFSTIIPGEIVFSERQSHVGIYAGNGLYLDCDITSNGDGVQISDKTWYGHAQIIYIDYSDQGEDPDREIAEHLRAIYNILKKED